MGSNKGGERTTYKQLDLTKSDKSTVYIYLDTNFIMALAQMPNFNLSYELDRVIPGSRELIVLDQILLELHKLNKEGSPKTQKESKTAIEFVQKHSKVLLSEYKHKNVDFVLLHHGKMNNAIIATNDRKLKRLAQKQGIRTLYIRNKRFLELK